MDSNDEGHNIISCNQDFEKLFHFKESDMVGRNLDELIAGQEYIEDAISYTKETLKGMAIHGSGKRQRKDGAYIDVEFIGVPIIIDGKVIGAYGIYRDISERKREEEALRESDERGNDFIFKDLNRAGERIENIKKEDLIGKSVLEVFPGVKEFGLFDVFKRVWETGKPEDHPISLYKDEKIIGWRENYIYKLPSGEIVAVYDDVTERKRTVEALRQSELELSIRNQIANTFLTIPYEEMYEEVLRVILEAMESRFGVFGYINEQGALVCPSMTRDIWDQCQVPDKDIVFPRDTWGGIWERALIEGKPLYSNESFSVPEGHIPIKSALSVPIILHGEVIGLLTVANKETGYDEKDQAFLESIAKYIAPVLHARLQRDRQEEDKKKLEDQL
ncbi:MAG: GAF domain-containing protein, partial [Deltaproteobacteria bacterium]|nr:GAF domain-containing protein [Deltaproteobacteria bacterium]